MTTLMVPGKLNAEKPLKMASPPRGNEVLEYGDPCSISCLQLAWNGMKRANGPCQLWTYCCDQSGKYCVAFISTYTDAWIDFGARSENKVLFGAIGFGINGWMKFMQVVRIGKDVPEATKKRIERLKAVPFQKVFNECEGEIVLEHDDDRESIRRKIAKVINVEPCKVRV